MSLIFQLHAQIISDDNPSYCPQLELTVHYLLFTHSGTEAEGSDYVDPVIDQALNY